MNETNLPMQTARQINSPQVGESELVVHEPQVPIVPPAKVDAAQARVEHVAKTLEMAYQKASTLELTDEESHKLTAEFGDEAVRTGAGGDANLLYIEHAFIRGRLHEVFGPGKWACINRRTWLDEQAGFMYADCVMLVKGCYIGEAIGAQRYSANNARLNYSDAVEGAQSEALRRIAGKYLGIGLQVWRKGYCDEWKARQGVGKAPARQMTQRAPEPSRQPAVSHPEDNVSFETAAPSNPPKAVIDAINADLPLAMPETPAASELPELVGLIEAITSKATKKPGSYRFGFKIGGEWCNSFNKDHSQTAQQAKDEGKQVRVLYKITPYGKDVEFLNIIP